MVKKRVPTDRKGRDGEKQAAGGPGPRVESKTAPSWTLKDLADAKSFDSQFGKFLPTLKVAWNVAAKLGEIHKVRAVLYVVEKLNQDSLRSAHSDELELCSETTAADAKVAAAVLGELNRAKLTINGFSTAIERIEELGGFENVTAMIREADELAKLASGKT